MENVQRLGRCVILVEAYCRLDTVQIILVACTLSWLRPTLHYWKFVGGASNYMTFGQLSFCEPERPGPFSIGTVRQCLTLRCSGPIEP